MLHHTRYNLTVILEFAILVLPGRFVSNGFHDIPMLCNLAVRIEAKDVKSDLLASSCKVVDRLQEYLVSVLESADIIDCGLYRSRCKVSYFI
jgi:hypothetical protein